MTAIVTDLPAPEILDESRLEALRALPLLDTSPEKAFDRLTELARDLLDIPVSLVSVVDDRRQWFKSSAGLPEPWATLRQTPLSHSFCKHVVATEQPLIIEDATQHDLVRDNLAVRDLNVIAYLGIPLMTPEGHVIGSFCAIDGACRAWEESDIKIMTELAELVMTEISLRHQIKERDKAEKVLASQAAELARSNEELEQFAYVVSHDLKAPLRGIRSLAEWIVEDYEEVIGEDGQKQLALLQGRTDRMQDLIDGILKYSRAGRQEGDALEVDFHALIQEALLILDAPAHIQITVETEMPAYWCEPARIGQVFQNLIGNAIKYNDKPAGHIRIGCEDKGSVWECYVADNGPGIDAKYFGKIFQLFQKLESRDEVEGTGVGLALVKKIIEVHGGQIRVESKVGEGSTFFFTLPKKSVVQAPPEEKAVRSA